MPQSFKSFSTSLVPFLIILIFGFLFFQSVSFVNAFNPLPLQPAGELNNQNVDPHPDNSGDSTNGLPGQGLPGENLAIQDVFAIINGIACWLLRIVTAVMVIFLVLAGLRFMWARGDPIRTITARKNLLYVLWGILVVMGVYVIIATVANAVGASFSFIPLRC